MVVKNKLDFCVSRSTALHQKIINAKEKEAKEREVATNQTHASKFTRPPTMGELHIDNQIKRETASSDYTPLNMAIHRAPKPPVRQGSAERDLSSHRLSRTDSQISNSSSGSGRTISTCSNSRSQSSPRVGPEAKQVHSMPPQLQHSLSQLKQKESHLHQIQRQQSQPTHRPVSQPQPVQRQISQPSRNVQPVNNRTQSHNAVQSQLVAHHSQQFQPIRQSQPPHIVQHPQPQLATSQAPPISRQSSTSSNKSVTLPANAHNLYKEVNIPTTLQRNDYIREGYRAPAVTERRGCPSPSVIPPPREFQEPSAPSPVIKQSSYDSSNVSSTQNQRAYSSASQQPAQPYSRSASSTSTYAPPYPPKMHISNHNQPTCSQSITPRPTVAPTHDISYNRDISQKHSKKDIRDILVQDMLKRQGNPSPSNTTGPTAADIGRSVTSNTQPNHNNQYKITSNYLAKNPPLVDEPLWTPPQPSPFDRGLSHYDKPTYHRQNLYGQVNHTPSSRYSSGATAQTTSLVSFVLSDICDRFKELINEK